MLYTKRQLLDVLKDENSKVVIPGLSIGNADPPITDADAQARGVYFDFTVNDLLEDILKQNIFTGFNEANLRLTAQHYGPKGVSAFLDQIAYYRQLRGAIKIWTEAGRQYGKPR